jgi:homoserine kinase type II
MLSLTCLTCPNGCGLKIDRKKNRYTVKGNRCIRGVSFAKGVLKKKGFNGVFLSEKTFLSYEPEVISSLLSLWNRKLTELEGNRFIQGSPERALYRCSLLSGTDRLILEQIDRDQANKHEITGTRLERLKAGGMPVSSFIRGTNGLMIQEQNGKYWQLSPYCPGTPLNRKNYWQDSWRGKELGRFLVQLYEQEKPEEGEIPFNLEAFIKNLTEKISLTRPALRDALNPILTQLEEDLFPLYDSIPFVFGHGDPHPLNIIWGKDRIVSVIDWEFCGTKPILYDSALIMGCVGSESPEAFDGPFNQAFYKEIQKAIPSPWLSLLPKFILAQRFAWMNEWLRHEDESMVKQELSYMEMLL